MKALKKLFSVLFLAAALTAAAAPDTKNWTVPPQKNWHLTLESALEAAQKSGKKIFVFHTGSDWCGWCTKLKKDVLMTAKFKNFVKKNLEFVYLDSPSQRVSMPAEQRNYNRKTWQSLGGGGGVPHAMVLDSQGKRIGNIAGYRPLKQYIKALDTLVKQAPRPNAAPAVPAAAATVKTDSAGWLQAPEGWFNKLEPALAIAKKENKKLLVLATGSDWCPPCKRFGSDCLPSAEFKNYARQHLVLVFLDLPRRKNMPAEQLNYNRSTIAKIGMGRGVPAFAVLDPQGSKTGFFSGYGSISSFMSRLKAAAAATPQAFKADEEARGKRLQQLRNAKISIAGWKSIPEDPMRPLSELPETLRVGQKIYFYLNYELPQGTSCRIILSIPGMGARATQQVVSGKGESELRFTCNSARDVKYLLLSLISERKHIVYRRIPCNSKIIQ